MDLQTPKKKIAIFYQLAGWLLAGWLAGWLAGCWLAGCWLAGWLAAAGWLPAGWLVGCLLAAGPFWDPIGPHHLSNFFVCFGIFGELMALTGSLIALSASWSPN